VATDITNVNLSSTTCDTPAQTDNTASVINSYWAKYNFSVSLLQNGYIKFPTWLGGLVIQWGQVTTDINGGTLSVGFPMWFPNAAFVVVPVTNSPTDRITYVVHGSLSTTGFVIGNNGSSGYAYWIAVGN
jgi:hypothetical protein